MSIDHSIISPTSSSHVNLQYAKQYGRQHGDDRFLDDNFISTLQNSLLPESSESDKSEDREVLEPQKEEAKERWDFVRDNMTMVKRKSIVTKLLSRSYMHYADIPTVEAIISALFWERNVKKQLLSERKKRLGAPGEFLQNQQGIHDVLARELIAHKQEKFRQDKHDNKLNNLIAVLRLDHSERTNEQLTLVFDWMMDNCPKHSLCYNFMTHCEKSSALDFCRGLNYMCFDKNEAIIRQGERGNAYYILLAGSVSVYTNRKLWKGDIANVKKNANSSKGIGEKCNEMCTGHGFGDLALLTVSRHVHRCASILTNEVTECLHCTDFHFKQCIEKYATGMTMTWISDLKQFYVMRAVDDVHMRSIFRWYKKCKLYPGQILQQQGKKISMVYLVIAGSVKEWYHNKQISLIDCDKNMIGGYYALKNMIPPTTMVCMTHCDAICVSLAHFSSSTNLSFQMTQRIIQVGGQKHETLMQRIETANCITNMFSTKQVKQPIKNKIVKNLIDCNNQIHKSAGGTNNQRQKRRRSVSLMDSKVKANIQMNVIKTLPKILKNQHDHDIKNVYNTNKKRMRSASLAKLKQKYGDPTDIWQMDVCINDISQHKSRNMKQTQRSRSASILHSTQNIFKEYDENIPNKASFSSRNMKRTRSCSELGTGNNVSIGNNNLNIRRRSQSMVIGKKKKKKSAHKLAMQFKDIKRQYRLLNTGFKKHKSLSRLCRNKSTTRPISAF